MPNELPRGLPAGRNSSPCSFANWAAPIPCATSATAWLVVWAVWCMSAWPKRPADPPCPTPTSTVRPPSSKNCSGPRWRASASSKGWVPANTNSASRTSCSRWIPTTISLCLSMYPWAQFRRAKGGVKAHVLLDHDDYLPAYVLLTEAKRSDVKLADSFRLNPGSIVAIDRGYNDYTLFGRWTLAGVFFVTRLKDNAAFEVVEECQIPQNRNIRADQLIRLTGVKAQADYPELLRRVVVWDAENEREIVLLTNLLQFGSTT